MYISDNMQKFMQYNFIYHSKLKMFSKFWSEFINIRKKGKKIN